jgi:hypothetical protein
VTLFSYVVEHDTGHAPNPYFGFCTLCLCKFRDLPGKSRNIVELAKPGDWVVGTGGADQRKSAGHGKLIYAMQVETKITRQQYSDDRDFKAKKPVPRGNYDQERGDNKPPSSTFERLQQFVLISKRHFYYFGRNAISIPRKILPGLEKRGPGFKHNFDEAYVARFVEWISKNKTGVHGDPCLKEAAQQRRKQICKPPC